MATLGFILYTGPSQLDAKPIVCIATTASHNHKTGPMMQTWILRQHIAPEDAVNSGEDSSVCGDCPLRGIVQKQANRETVNRYRGCYVFVAQAPQKVWDSWKLGLYEPRPRLSDFAGQVIRLGAYGDPCAVPLNLWSDIAAVAAGWTGYTHQWREPGVQGYRRLLMASVESIEQADEARSMGWRTFRVAPTGEAPAPGEFHCPASAEEGYRATCEDCGACNGTSGNPDRASVVIWPHGPPAAVKSFYRLTAGASKQIDHRQALNTADLEALAVLRETGRQSAAELGRRINRGAQATATRLWHMRQMGVVRRVGRGQYEATEVNA